jgi:putative endonuclease
MDNAHIVYILRSLSSPDRHYIGITSDIERRLAWHNAGENVFTRNNRPWEVTVSMAFSDPHIAARFERYLKSGSGRAFAKRHFGPEC